MKNNINKKIIVKNFYKNNNLTPIINVSGFMTKIGASITNQKSIKAANEIFTNFVHSIFCSMFKNNKAYLFTRYRETIIFPRPFGDHFSV